MNTVSVAMATFNGEKYLREQLDSLYSQTLLPNEIIVVDDCSTDSTQVILEEYRSKKGLTYFVNESNKGINKNFEKAIRLCKGEYIALCDQDDIWMPHKIEKSVSKLMEIEKNGLPSLVTSNNISIDAIGKVINYHKKECDSFEYYVSLFGHYMQGCSMFMNKKLLNYILPLPEDNDRMYDVFIGITASMVGNKYNIGVPLMYHRRHETNVTTRITGTKKNSICAFNKFFPFYSIGRLMNMMYIENRNSPYFIYERKELFYYIIKIAKERSIIKKIKLILYIEELSFKNKLEAIFSIFCNYIKSI